MMACGNRMMAFDPIQCMSSTFIITPLHSKTHLLFQFAMSIAITPHKSLWNRWAEHDSIRENNINDKIIMFVCVCTWWSVLHVEIMKTPVFFHNRCMTLSGAYSIRLALQAKSISIFLLLIWGFCEWSQFMFNVYTCKMLHHRN